MLLFLVAPVAAERARAPGIVGLILAGTVVGPHALNLLDRDRTIELLGTVGLLYLVFVAGLELDLHRFAKYRARSLTFGLISFLVPMGLALLVFPVLGYDMWASVLIGSIIGSHTLLAYPIVSRLGIVRNAAVTTVVGGTLVTDTLALGVLAVVAGAYGAEGALGTWFWVQLVGGLAIYVAVVFIGVPRLGRWFFKNVPSEIPAEFIFLMTVLFAVAYGANLAGAQPIIGAFLAGLTLNRLIPGNSPLMTRVRFVGSALFIPFFLLSVGMLVDPWVLLTSIWVWITAIALTVLVSLGKGVAAFLTQVIFRYSRSEGLMMFGLSVPQAAATLAVTFVGRELGVFGEMADVMVNGVVVMILVTGVVGPYLVEQHGRRTAQIEELSDEDASEAQARILIPLANPKSADELMTLAILLRADSDEPLFPLMVVPEEGEAGEGVARAERMLGHAVVFAAGAEVPVHPLTRVARNIATGIARGVTERRITTVVVGWDGHRSAGTAVFGSVVDQLLAQSRQQVLVARTSTPINTTRRVVVVLPHAGDHHPGAASAVRTIKRLASELDATILCLAVEKGDAEWRGLFNRQPPAVPLAVQAVPGWVTLPEALTRILQPDDLVVVFSARQGTVAWRRELDQLPGVLAERVENSFVMLYPPEPDPSELNGEEPSPPG